MLIFESITEKQHFRIDGVPDSQKQWARWPEQQEASLSGVEVIVEEQREGGGVAVKW